MALKQEHQLAVIMTTKGLKRYLRRLEELTNRDRYKADSGHREWLDERISDTKNAIAYRLLMDEHPDFAALHPESFWGVPSDRDDLIEGGE